MHGQHNIKNERHYLEQQREDGRIILIWMVENIIGEIPQSVKITNKMSHFLCL